MVLQSCRISWESDGAKNRRRRVVIPEIKFLVYFVAQRSRFYTDTKSRLFILFRELSSARRAGTNKIRYRNEYNQYEIRFPAQCFEYSRRPQHANIRTTTSEKIEIDLKQTDPSLESLSDRVKKSI